MRNAKAILSVLTLFALQVPLFAGWVWTEESGIIGEDEYALPNPDASFEKAKEEFKNGQYESAAEKFDRLSMHTDKPELAKESRLWLGKAYYESGEYLQSMQVFREYLNQFPNSPKTNEIVRKEMEIGFKLLKGKDRHKVLGVGLLPTTKTGKNVIRNILSNYPYQKYSDLYHYKFANHFFNEEQYQLAIQEYKQFLKKYTDSEWRENVQYLLGVSYYNSVQTLSYDTKALKKAEQELETYLDNYPEGEYVQAAKEILGQINHKSAKKDYQLAEWYKKTGKKESSIFYLQEIVRNYPRSIWAKKARNQLKSMEADVPEVDQKAVETKQDPENLNEETIDTKSDSAPGIDN